jgi:hypothetical protein
MDHRIGIVPQGILLHNLKENVDGYQGNAQHEVLELLKAIYIVINNIEIKVHAQHLPKLKERKIVALQH